MLRVQGDRRIIDYYTVDELTKISEFKRSTIYKYMKEGRLSYKMIDQERFIDIQELRELKSTLKRGRPSRAR